MCGIFVSIHQGHTRDIRFEALCQQLKDANATRGPDAQRSIFVSCPSNLVMKEETMQRLQLEFYSSELRLRGTVPVVQPHEHDGNILCWNGEIFEGLDIAAEENDGVKLFARLHELQNPEEIVDVFGSIEGPYAFAYYQGASKQFYFARDPLGRRSLMIHKPTSQCPYFLLTSVTIGATELYDFEELPTSQFYHLDLLGISSSADIVIGSTTRMSTLPRFQQYAGSSPRSFALPARVNTVIPPDSLKVIESLDDIPPYLSRPVDDLLLHLDNSVRLRVRDIACRPASKKHGRIAILFSGGIDCTMVAYFAHKHLPSDEPIDLLNVAFENPYKLNTASRDAPKKHRKRKQETQNNNVKSPYLVPDRITGLQQLEELRRIIPSRTWNFVSHTLAGFLFMSDIVDAKVEIDVPFEEAQTARPVVESLMWPQRTVMDLSLAMALYFASRGRGQVRHSVDSAPEPYSSYARILLSGLGSDELLGGYGRHRTAFKRGGWSAVIEELQLEIDRISTRNLGRDDRVISCHGKETRYPFLSLSVISFLAKLAVHFKTDPRLENGIGDKMLLRLAARKLSLVEASERKKRAMQFGSRSARMEGEKKGDTVLE